MSTTVTYKGNTITTVNNNTKTLTTAGKYLEANVILTDITEQNSSSSGYTRTVVVPEQTVTPTYHSDGNTNGYSAQLNNVTEMFEQWSEYIVTFNGTEYYFTTILMWGSNYLMGEQSYLWYGNSGTVYPYPFCVISISINDSYIYTASADSVTVKIEKIELTGSGGGSVTWELMADQTCTITTYEGMRIVTINGYNEPLSANETYRITWGDNQYICNTIADPVGFTQDGYYMGNSSIFGSQYEDTGEPFVFYRTSSTRLTGTTDDTASSVYVKIERQTTSSATLITKTITANGTYSASDDSAAGYSEVTVNVPSGGASSWTKVAETSYQVSTTNTSTTNVATWATGHSEIWTSDKFVYVRIRDTAGKRAGYFYGIDAWVMNRYPKTPSLSSYTSSSELVYQIWRVNSAGEYACRYGYNTTGYGVFPDTIYNNGAIRIRSRYNSSYSLTINGTYKVEVYLLDHPTGAPIFT